MKVILLKDVAKIGRRLQIVTVPDGYALNKLIPNGMAKSATPENVKMLQAVTSKQKENQEHDSEVFKGIVSSLKDRKIEITVEANAEGKMFQALKSEAVAESISKEINVKVGGDAVVIKTPIKTLGDHEVELASGSLHGTVTITLIAKTK